MKLNDIIDGIYNAAKGSSEVVLREYNKVPVRSQPDIYAVVGVSSVKLSESFCYEGGEDYPLEITLGVRVLGKECCNPMTLYSFLDETILTGLSGGGYVIKAINVSNAEFDHALRRLVISAEILVCGSCTRKEAPTDGA